MSIFRKIGRILLLVGGIFELLTMGLCFLLAIAAFVVPFVPLGLDEAVQQYVMIGGIAGGVVLLFLAVFCLVAGVLGIKGFKAHEKGNYIGCIVFGILTGWELLLIAGAILGLIALKKEAKAEPQPEPEPEKAE